MTQPSIKGTAISDLVESVRKLAESGEISQSELARRLEPDDLALLEQSIVPSQWYDIASYTRMSELLLDLVGNGNRDYIRKRGRAKGAQLIEGGLYQQLEYLKETETSKLSDPEARFAAFGRDLRLIGTLSGSLISFGVWTPEPDPERPGRYRIEVTEARDFPDVLGWSSEGFIDAMSSAGGNANLWRWERVDADTVRYVMLRPLG